MGRGMSMFIPDEIFDWCPDSGGSSDSREEESNLPSSSESEDENS